MWSVRLALRRPYTFVVFALLILTIGPFTIVRDSLLSQPISNNSCLALARCPW